MSLEKKLAHLEDKINRMIPLLDEEKDPFAYLSVVQDWTREQVDLIFSLMEEVERSPTKTSFSDFERRVANIIPGMNYEMAEAIVVAFQDNGEYPGAVRHLMKRGMDIS